MLFSARIVMYRNEHGEFALPCLHRPFQRNIFVESDRIVKSSRQRIQPSHPCFHTYRTLQLMMCDVDGWFDSCWKSRSTTEESICIHVVQYFTIRNDLDCIGDLTMSPNAFWA